MLDQLGNYFKPTFLLRLHTLVTFKPLSKDDLLHIVSHNIKHTNNNLKSQGLTITVTDPVKTKLVTLGYNHSLGARHLRRVIQTQITHRVAHFYLDTPNAKTLTARISNGTITVGTPAKATASSKTAKL